MRRRTLLSLTTDRCRRTQLGQHRGAGDDPGDRQPDGLDLAPRDRDHRCAFSRPGRVDSLTRKRAEGKKPRPSSGCSSSRHPEVAVFVSMPFWRRGVRLPAPGSQTAAFEAARSKYHRGDPRREMDCESSKLSEDFRELSTRRTETGSGRHSRHLSHQGQRARIAGRCTRSWQSSRSSFFQSPDLHGAYSGKGGSLRRFRRRQFDRRRLDESSRISTPGDRDPVHPEHDPP